MEAPPEFLERLRAYDPRLFVKWNGRVYRWEIWRKGPTESAPPWLVKLWCRYEPKATTGSYLPLDNRLIAWLRESDMAYRFRDHDAKYWARLHMRELDEQNRLADEKRKKDLEPWHEEGREGLAFAFRKDLRIGNPVPRAIRKDRRGLGKKKAAI